MDGDDLELAWWPQHAVQDLVTTGCLSLFEPTDNSNVGGKLRPLWNSAEQPAAAAVSYLAPTLLVDDSKGRIEHGVDVLLEAAVVHQQRDVDVETVATSDHGDCWSTNFGFPKEKNKTKKNLKVSLNSDHLVWMQQSGGTYFVHKGWSAEWPRGTQTGCRTPPHSGSRNSAGFWGAAGPTWWWSWRATSAAFLALYPCCSKTKPNTPEAASHQLRPR